MVTDMFEYANAYWHLIIFFLIVYEFWSLVVTLIFLMILLCGFLNIGTEAAPRKKGGAATA
jgi:hypothetical protein